MKKGKRLFAVAAAFAMTVQLTACGGKKTAADDNDFRIVTSFYPMQILTMNLADGIDGVTVTSMSDPNIGCIHDHVFSTEDLKKIEGADLYVENGLGLETFNDKILNSYPDLIIVEAAADVKDAPSDGDEENGHVWTSLEDYILEIKSVSAGLQAADPEHAKEYADNEKTYIEKIEKLKSDNASVIDAWKGEGALILDETLPSFGLFMNLDMITIETDHEQEALSAGDIQDAIEEMKKKGINAIFVADETDESTSDAIKKETGAKVYKLNTCMTGKVDKDAYINQMTENFQLLSGND